ncbi:MAG: Holliday junction DNA helicase RuvA [Phycisphaerae bacterium]|jgi:Holliday junction DNA helicase RuvA|nr:Holliday junction DNA helicase RuvA [Phycisphaerae bacterium]
MIARIAGILKAADKATVLIDAAGGLWYELLVPACDAERHARRLGQEVVLHTLHFIEGDPSRGMQQPRLIGFCSEADRDFFRIFTTVKGVGVRKALRAMARPVAEVAAAIQNKDAGFLVALPEIGKRTAEQIIAELTGKVDAFAGPPPEPAPVLPEAASEAVSVLVQLGERAAEAQALVERVLAVSPELDAPEAILQAAYRVKAGSR